MKPTSLIHAQQLNTKLKHLSKSTQTEKLIKMTDICVELANKATEVAVLEMFGKNISRELMMIDHHQQVLFLS